MGALITLQLTVLIQEGATIQEQDLPIVTMAMAQVMPIIAATSIEIRVEIRERVEYMEQHRKLHHRIKISGQVKAVYKNKEAQLCLEQEQRQDLLLRFLINRGQYSLEARVV